MFLVSFTVLPEPRPLTVPPRYSAELELLAALDAAELAALEAALLAALEVLDATDEAAELELLATELATLEDTLLATELAALEALELLLVVHVIFTFDTLVDAIVPEPFVTLQV